MARARAAGLPVPAGAAGRGDAAALMCAPGFSTRDESDRASGRGVGMSVVQAASRSCRGTLPLETRAGRRHALRHRAAGDAGDHRCADRARSAAETFAVPQGAVREVIEVPVGDLLQVERNEMIAVSRRGAAGGAAVAAVRDARQPRAIGCTCSWSAPAAPRSASRSIGSSASAKSSCARSPIRWSASTAFPARPISATATSC